MSDRCMLGCLPRVFPTSCGARVTTCLRRIRDTPWFLIGQSSSCYRKTGGQRNLSPDVWTLAERPANPKVSKHPSFAAESHHGVHLRCPSSR